MYRAWWSLFLSEVAAVGEKGHKEALEKVMALPEVEFTQLAASNPNYRLAVVDAKITTSDRVMDENFELQRITYYLVVKMEDK